MKKLIIGALLISPFALMGQTVVTGEGSKTFEKIELPDPAVKETITEFDNHYINGASYYNRAIVLLERTTEGKDEVKVEDIIEQVTDIFKMSEDYLLKANALDAEHKETRNMLSHVYFALGNYEKSKAFGEKTSK